MVQAISVINFVIGCLGFIIYFLMFYQLFISFWGFKRNAKDYSDFKPEMRFLVLVPAHNEEAVISDIVHNLQEMDYPKDLYDFYILADNCTDRTQEISEALGAKVLVSKKESENEPTGKPIVLQKALQMLKGYQNRYDLIMIFDADNLIDRNMFREVNSQYLSNNKNCDFIQCYLGCKNNEGPVALSDYISYTISNRFFNLAKHRLHVNAGIGGTGFAVSTKYLYERGGWTSMSLTEDFEIQMEATCEGRRVLWNNTVRVHDEKPTNLWACFRQRIRWAQGRWFVSFKNTKPLFRALFSKKISFWEFLSSLTSMYNMSIFPILVLQELLKGTTDLLYFLNHQPIPRTTYNSIGEYILSILPFFLFFVYSMFFSFYWADRVDNKHTLSPKRIVEFLLSVLINSYVTGLSHLIGLFKCRQQKHWVKTEHKITTSSTVNTIKANIQTELQ